MDIKNIAEYSVFYSIAMYMEEAATKNYSVEIQKALKEAQKYVIPSSSMLRILPDVTLSFKRYRERGEWRKVEKENENTVVNLVKNNVTMEEYSASYTVQTLMMMPLHLGHFCIHKDYMEENNYSYQ